MYVRSRNCMCVVDDRVPESTFLSSNSKYWVRETTLGGNHFRLQVGVAPGPLSCTTSFPSRARTWGTSYARDSRIVNIMINQGERFAFPANAADFDSADCEAAFEGLDNLDDVTCSRGSVDAFGGATFDIGELHSTTQSTTRQSHGLCWWLSCAPGEAESLQFTPLLGS